MGHPSIIPLDNMDAHAAEDLFPDHDPQFWGELREQRALQLDVPAQPCLGLSRL